MTPMVTFTDVTLRYGEAGTPALRHASFSVPEGELALVVGPTGSGKSTLLRCVNGLVPHFTGGHLDGRVEVAGHDTRTHPPRALAEVVGLVEQNPSAGFVTDLVEDELAYAMESLGVPPATMRRRVEEVLDLLGLADLRDRPLRTLSAGQQQRAAIGSVLTVHPKVLVLDEPTSALDPQGAEEVLAVLHRLVHDLGMTVLVSEHRLERVVQLADRVLVVERGEVQVFDDPAEAMATAPVVPPVVALGRIADWSPLPLTIRAARRASTQLRAELAGLTIQERAVAAPDTPPVADLRRVSVHHPGVVALREVDLALAPGEVVALMGRNGAGKSTLLRVLAGLASPQGGSAQVDGADPTTLRGRDRLGRVGFVPANPGDLLWAASVRRELLEAERDAGVSAQARSGSRDALERLLPGLDLDTHPGDLSEGQRLAVALAVVLGADPGLLLLDEPTRGLDYATKERLVALLRERQAHGTGVLLATHDVELVAEVATRVVVLADGDVVTDAVAREALVASPSFAPQVAKVMAPLAMLTPREVAHALAAVRAGRAP